PCDYHEDTKEKTMAVVAEFTHSRMPSVLPPIQFFPACADCLMTQTPAPPRNTFEPRITQISQIERRVSAFSHPCHPCNPWSNPHFICGHLRHLRLIASSSSSVTSSVLSVPSVVNFS